MATTDGIDRRRYARVNARIRVTLSKDDAPAFDATVLMRDLSADGIGFVASSTSEESVDALSRVPGVLEVEMTLDERRPVRIPARLVWGCIERGPARAQVFTGGLRFVDLTERDRNDLRAFIAARAPEPGQEGPERP